MGLMLKTDSRCLYALALVSVAASAVTAQQLTTLVDSGPANNRVDMVILGDGYTQADLDAGQFDVHIDSLLDYKFTSGFGGITDPFPRYQSFFNIHKIEIPSAESGADIPSEDISVDTALDASYDTGGINRLLYINNGLANAARNAALAGTGITADIQYVTVNSTKYGGGGGSYAVYAGGNNSAREIALHEMGHSFIGLADEYDTPSIGSLYMGPENSSPNVTINPQGLKWQHWIGYDDPRGSDLDIGVFEGAAYYPRGLYRPAVNGKMRSIGQAFHAVSREQAILSIYEKVNPLDDWRAGQLIAEGELWVEAVDASVIKTDWYVDDVLACEACPQNFNPLSQNLGPGQYTIRAHAYDEVVKNVGTGNALDLVRIDLDELQQEVEWQFVVLDDRHLFNAGDYNVDGRVDAADYSVWRDSLGSHVEAFSAADGNGNGTIDQADYAHWSNRYGSTLQSATLIDSSSGNGSFEEVGGATFPRLVIDGDIAIPDWTATADGRVGWHNGNANASSEGDVYAIATGGSTLTLTSDPIAEHTAGEGDLFTLSFETGSNDGALTSYEAFLVFGDEEHLIGVLSEAQDVDLAGLTTHSYEYVAKPEDSGLHPRVKLIVGSGSDFSQAYIDNVRLDVDFWSFGQGSPSLTTVPEPSSLLAFLIMIGSAASARPRRNG